LAASGRIILALVMCILLGLVIGRPAGDRVTTPFEPDHNRMLVDGEIQRADGSWRPVRLWIDNGNPEFFISESLVRDLGIDLEKLGHRGEMPPPAAVRIGGKPLDFSGVTCRVLVQSKWLFSTMHDDANIPSTVLRQYLGLVVARREMAAAANIADAMGRVINALRGEPGQERRLVLERDGMTVARTVRVERQLGYQPS